MPVVRIVDPMQFYVLDTPAEQLRGLAEQCPSAGVVRRPSGIRWKHGRVRAERDGLHCERIFGPLRTDACMCGKYRGPEHRGVICDRCGVLVGDPAMRERTWAHAESKFGVVHPVLARAAASELGVDVERLLADPSVEMIEQLVELESRCRHGLRVHRFPIPPPGLRPLAASPDDPSATPWLPGLLDERFAGLIRQINYLDRLVELGAPELIVAHELAAATRALARLTESGPAGLRLWGEPQPEDPPVLLGRAPASIRREAWARPPRLHVRSMVFWGRDRLILEGAPGLRMVEIESGTVTRIPAGFCTLLGVVGDVLVVSDVGDEDWAAVNAARWLAAYELSTSRWLEALPKVPFARFEKDQPEDAALVDVRTGAIAGIEIDSDRPAYGAHTPNLSHILVLGDDSGPVCSSATGWPVFELGIFEDADDSCEEACAVAIARRGEAWQVLLPDARVGVLDRAGPRIAWTLARPATAACFSADGELLALARGRSIAIHDAEGRLLHTLKDC